MRVAKANTHFLERVGEPGGPVFLDKSIVIHASAQAVFAWLAPARMPRWDPSLVRQAPEALGPVATGMRFARVSRALGHRFEMDAEATDVESARVFAWRQVSGDFQRHEGAYLLEPVAEGTRVRLLAEMEFPYVMPRLVTEDELQREVSREADEALLNLKSLVEAASAG